MWGASVLDVAGERDVKQAIGHQGPGAARPSMHTISQHRQPASRRRHDFAAEAAGTGQRAVGSLHRLHGGLDVHARAPRARAPPAQRGGGALKEHAEAPDPHLPIPALGGVPGRKPALCA